MKRIIGSVALGLVIASASGSASAAAGSTSVAGLAPVSVSRSIGTTKAGAIYLDSTNSSYTQFPGATGELQKLTLSATGGRSLLAYLFDKQIHVLSLWADSEATRQGSHMTGSADAKITVNGAVVWQDSDDYDVTAWAGSEAEVGKAQTILSHSKSASSIIAVGPATVLLTGSVSGSISASASAMSDFMSSNGRHGKAQGVTSGSARADLHATASFVIPFVGGLGVFADVNVIKVDVPNVAVAVWSWQSSRPVASRNEYTAVTVLNVTGETGGGIFGARILGPFNVELHRNEIAKWNGKQLFTNVVNTNTSSDIGQAD